MVKKSGLANALLSFANMQDGSFDNEGENFSQQSFILK
jgi:hypothetical protein